MVKTGTVTVIFTDLVGSTEIASQLGAEAADDLRHEHDALLRDAIAGYGGNEVKHLGDGVMAVFSGAADAVGCAVAIQRAVEMHTRHGGGSLSIRVGLSAGDVTREGDDVFGEPVIEASRLCALAGGGQILAGDVVRLLVNSRGGHDFVSLGERELKGLPEPRPVCEVGWAPAEDAPGVPLPTVLARAPLARLVGRTSQREQLARAWKRTSEGALRVVLLTGEPGIGKTRLAADVARAAHHGGATVLFGRCDDELGVPYQPFAEALRHYAMHSPISSRRTELGPLAAELTRIVPELATAVPELHDPIPAEPETEQYRLFEAVSTLFSNASRGAPILLVLDDLQWAAKPTLLMLRHLVRSSDTTRMLVIGTYRDTDLGRTHPLADMLADLRRDENVERITLLGLKRSGVEAFLESASGHQLDDTGKALASVLHGETEGNPFFIGEILLSLVENGLIHEHDGRWISAVAIDQLHIPDSVREVIGRRLSSLSETANKALATAAVVGRDFDLPLVEAASDVTTDELLDAFDEACERNVVRQSSDRVGRYSFGHVLVRQTLYDELSTARRVRLHRRIGEAIEAAHPDDIEPHLPTLAHHFGEAAAAGNIDKAVDYARRAADQALNQVAYEEAGRLCEHALALKDADDPHPAMRCELHLLLGAARLGAGRTTDAKAAFRAAAEDAHTVDDSRVLARVALARAGVPPVLGVADVEAIELVDAALDVLPVDAFALRAELLAWRTFLSTMAQSDDDREQWAAQAVTLARQADESRALVHALHARLVSLAEPVDPTVEHDTADELVRVAVDNGNPFLEFEGRSARARAALMQGDAAAADADVDALSELADGLHQPVLVARSHLHRAARAAAKGRLAAAEAAALETPRCSEDPAVVQQFAIVITTVLGALNRQQETLPIIEENLRANPDRWIWRVARASHLAALGRIGDARADLEAISAMDIRSLKRDAQWLAGLCGLARVCRIVDAPAVAETLLELLKPYAGRGVVVGGGLTYVGTVDRALGQLAAIVGDRDAAVEYFDAALARENVVGARPWLAETQVDAARVRLERRAPRDEELAIDLLEAARGIADEIEMHWLAREAAQLLAQPT